ncbi:MAG: DNA recombination/repair protein RecA, partial [Pseudobdellovibrio sp.]
MAAQNNQQDAKSQNEKLKALELAVTTIEKQFGKGSIMRLGNDGSLAKDVEIIPTGSLSLDIAL